MERWRGLMMPRIMMVTITGLLVVIACGCERRQESMRSSTEKLPAVRGAARTDEFWLQRSAALAERIAQASAAQAGPSAPGSVVFVGDSITQGWEETGAGGAIWREQFEEMGAINLGVSGDRTVHVLNRIEHCGLERLATRTRMVVLLIGTNDLAAGTTPEATVAGIGACVAALRAKLPEAQVYVLEVLPRGAPGEPIRAQVDACNAWLRRMVERGLVQAELVPTRELFLGPASEIAGATLPDGPIDPTLMPDLLHLSEAGYRLLASPVAQAMGK